MFILIMEAIPLLVRESPRVDYSYPNLSYNLISMIFMTISLILNFPKTLIIYSFWVICKIIWNFVFVIYFERGSDWFKVLHETIILLFIGSGVGLSVYAAFHHIGIIECVVMFDTSVCILWIITTYITKRWCKKARKYKIIIPIQREPECCVICLEDIQTNRATLNCKHFFHEHCISSWLDTNHDNCPICRSIV